MSLSAAAGGFVVFLLTLPGNVYIYILHTCTVFIKRIKRSLKWVQQRTNPVSSFTFKNLAPNIHCIILTE